MPVIRAIENQETPAVNETALARVTENLKPQSIEECLDANSAGVPDIARVVGSILNFSASDALRLRAAQLAIEFRNIGVRKNDNRIVFNLQGNNITLNNLIVQE